MKEVAEDSPRGRYLARLQRELTFHVQQRNAHQKVAKAIASQYRRILGGEVEPPDELFQRMDEILREDATYRRLVFPDRKTEAEKCDEVG